MPNISVRRDEASAPFFDATTNEQLLIKICQVCDRHAAPRAPGCRRCGAALTWTPAAGDATLVSWTATPAGREDPDRPPTIFGWVELAEGPWLEALLLDAALDTLAEGMPLRVTFIRRPDDDEVITVFRPT